MHTANRMLVTTKGAARTRAFGRRLARLLRPGDVVLLQGPLGAGKTTLVQGVGSGLGVPGPVASPTFVLLARHDLPEEDVRPERPRSLYHADLYRLDTADLIAELGLDQAAEGGILLVEWPERAQGGLPIDHLHVQITPLEEDISEDALDASPRELTLNASGELAATILEQLSKQFAAVPA